MRRRPVQIHYSSIVGGVVVFVLSLLLSPYYIDGDQITYRGVYDDIEGMPFIDAFDLYAGTFGYTAEVVHFTSILVGSKLGISKDLLMALINGVLAYCAMAFFNNMKVNPFLSMILVGTNYYFYGLYFAAERLKFGFLFFLIFILIRKKYLLSVSAACLSIFSHVQMGIVFSCIALSQKSNVVADYFLRLRLLGKIIVGVIICAAMYAVLGDYIILKFNTYSEFGLGRNISAFFRLTLFLLLSLWYSEDKNNTIRMFLLLYPATFFVGADRINMLGYVFYIYHGLRYNAGMNVGVFLTSIYFGLKGLSFIVEVVHTGQGYGEFTTFPGNVLF